MFESRFVMTIDSEDFTITNVQSSKGLFDWWDWFNKIKPKPKPPPPPPTGPIDGNEVVKYVNVERSKYSLYQYLTDPRLMKCAADYATLMAQRNTMDHFIDRTTPSSRMAKVGYYANWTSENIAWGQRSAIEVVQDWMSSNGHRKNILSTVAQYVGAGVSGLYWCLVFASAPKLGTTNLGKTKLGKTKRKSKV